MGIVKRLVCLANSVRHVDRCVAGREIVGRQIAGWIRPVGDRFGHELTAGERQYQDGGEPRLLDIIDVPLLGHTPHEYQRENWLIDPSRPVVKVASASWRDLAVFVEQSDLWTYPSSVPDHLNDRVPAEVARGFTSSLTMKHVDALRVRVVRRYSGLRARACFELKGTNFNLPLTDPLVGEHFLRRGPGVYEVGACYLTVSLGEVFNGFAYRIVAGVLSPTPLPVDGRA